MTWPETEPDFSKVKTCVSCQWSRPSARTSVDSGDNLVCTNKKALGPPSMNRVTGVILYPAPVSCRWERTDIGICGYDGVHWTAITTPKTVVRNELVPTEQEQKLSFWQRLFG